MNVAKRSGFSADDGRNVEYQFVIKCCAHEKRLRERGDVTVIPFRSIVGTVSSGDPMSARILVKYYFQCGVAHSASCHHCKDYLAVE